MHRMNWDDLQYVLAVAEAGSVASAARGLGVHHATVLRRIAAFEAQCGVQIFEKAGSGYRLTPESSHVLSAVRNIDGMVEELGRAIASQSSAITGPLRLTTTDSLSNAVVTRHCGEFCRLHPEVRIELLSSNENLNLSRLEADITIRPAKSLSPELVGEYICDLGFRVYATDEYLRSNPARDIAHHDWLGLAGPITRVPFLSWIETQVPTLSFVFLADSFVTLLAAAEESRGVAILPCCLGDRSDKLVRVEAIPARFTNNLWVAAHADLAGSPKIEAAMTFFREALRTDRALLEGQ